jgi:hypothetical protein
MLRLENGGWQAVQTPPASNERIKEGRARVNCETLCVCVFCSWCNKDMHNGNYECDCQGVNRGENENDDENEYDVI